MAHPVHTQAQVHTYKVEKKRKKHRSFYCLQAQRVEILRHLILRKSCLSVETLQSLDIGAVAKETEGYTPQDLVLLLERAVHANTMLRGHSEQGIKD